ncbi:hypothetical protein SBV45_03480 [Chlamydia crocodili]|uniref:PXA domain-containing protein n=1 Tax=Chlamydia crocodili TaxID=2766982 RepID=A0ABX8CJ13_9CHLA|nr:hypothetical protein [Chlamydia crocodili]QVE49167.1 hypothetical protein H9Q19_00430 [Chlamydia crocodili]
MTKPVSQQTIIQNQTQTSFPLCYNRSISSSALGILISVSAILATASVITCLSLACSSEILIVITAFITGILIILCFLQIVFHVHDQKQKAIKYPSHLQPIPIISRTVPALPQLPEAIFRELEQKISSGSEQATIENLIHVNQEDFFPDKDAWIKIFLRDPQFLLQSILASWKTCQTDGEEVTLSRNHIGFNITLTTRNFAELETESVINEQPKRCYIHQVLQKNLSRNIESQVIRTTLGNLNYVIPILRDSLTPNENTVIESKEDIDETLYKIFKSFFTKYYVALNASVSKEKIINLQLLRSGCPDIRVRQMEIFALFCAIEQMRFTRTPELPNLRRNTVESQQLPVSIPVLQPTSNLKHESPRATPITTAYESPYNKLRTFVPKNTESPRTSVSINRNHNTNPEVILQQSPYGQLRARASTETISTPQFDEIQTFLVQEGPQQDISTDVSQTSVYILSPEDYWKIFVEKDTTSFPRECSPYGLLSHPQGNHGDSMRNLNQARFMETENLVIANLTEVEIQNLSYLSRRENPERSRDNAH